MQEEVENRTLTLIVSGTKFTGRLFKAAVSKYMAHRKEKKLEKQRSRDSPVTPKGKQTVKQLIGQNQGVSNIEINDPSIRDFERIARKYGVDYAVKKDRSASPPKYLIFFKAPRRRRPDGGILGVHQKKVKKAEKTERPSVPEKLSHFKALIKNAVVDRTKRKELNDEAAEYEKAGPSEPALFSVGPVRHQPGRSLAAGDRRGCLGQDALVLFHPAGGAGELVAQPASAGPGCWPVLRRWPAAGGVPERQERKKYRHNVEYGSARWGTHDDIAPYIDPVFQNNVILTQTERLTMSSRPKNPSMPATKTCWSSAVPAPARPASGSSPT